MKSYRLPAFIAVAFAIACGAASNSDTAASAGSQQLSVTKLADVIGNSQVPLEKDYARIIAELWVNYQLVGLAAAKNDTINDKAVLDFGLWSEIQNMRSNKFGEELKKTLKPANADCNDECMYNRGDIMSARHILVMAPDGTIPNTPAATPEQRAIAKKKAEAIKAQATPANFVKLTEKSEEPNAKERGGDLGLFSKGGMVKPFELGVLATKPGTVSDVVVSAYGYHIIYRPAYAEVKDKVEAALKDRPIALAESTYFARIDSAAQFKVDKNIVIKVKAVARNPLGAANDNSTIAEYKGGTLTAARFADWVTAYPPQFNIRQALNQPNLPDTLIIDFVKKILHNEVLLQKADSAKIVADTAAVANVRLRARQNLASSWVPLGVDGPKLDSAKGTSDREKLAAKHVDAYFDKLIKNEAPFVDIPYPIARALQKKFTYAVNDGALDKAVDKAKAVRATADSLRAKQGPPMPGAPGAAPQAAPPATAKPPAPVKK